MSAWIAAASGMAVLALAFGARQWRSSQDSVRLVERLGGGRPKRVRGPLLTAVAARVARTYLGGRIEVYALRAHPGVLFSDVLAWGFVAVLGSGLAGWLLLGRGLPAALLALVAPAVLDRLVVRLRGSRASRLEKQLPESLALQASALRAGQSLVRSLRIVEEAAKPPLKDELGKILNAIDLGMPVEEAMEQFAARTSSRDIDLWIDAMLIHRQTGGSLAGVAESLAKKISQRLNLRSEIRALTAQGRLSGMVVAGAPVAFFVLLSVGSRDQMEILYTTPIGLVILIAGLTLNALGLLWIKLVLRIRP